MRKTPLKRKSWMKRGTKPLRKVNSARQEKRRGVMLEKVRGRRDAAGKMPLRRVPLAKRNAARRKKEFARAYGSKERVAFVRLLRCSVPGCVIIWPCDNAHVGNGGKGRKADADRIVPLCRGHHRLLHSWGRKRFEKYFYADRGFDIDLDLIATHTERRWQEHLRRSA